MFEWIKNLPKAVGIVTSLIPLIQLLMKSAETPGFGPEKKKVVLKGLKDFLVKEKVAEPLAKLVLIIASGLIEVYVFVFNVTDWLKHKDDEEDEE